MSSGHEALVLTYFVVPNHLCRSAQIFALYSTGRFLGHIKKMTSCREKCVFVIRLLELCEYFGVRKHIEKTKEEPFDPELMKERYPKFWDDEYTKAFKDAFGPFYETLFLQGKWSSYGVSTIDGFGNPRYIFPGAINIVVLSDY